MYDSQSPMIGELASQEPGVVFESQLQHRINTPIVWHQWQGQTGPSHRKGRMFTQSAPGYTSYKGMEIHNSFGCLDGNFVVDRAEKD